MTRYVELAADLRRRIARGAYPIGTLLPAEARLAEEYAVSRGTIRNALAALERRGMVEPTRGNGWQVTSALQNRRFDGARTFADWAAAHGLQPGGLVVASVRGAPTPSELRALLLGGRDAVLRITRVRTLDGRPVMLERSVYPPAIAEIIAGLPDDEPSVASALRAAGIDAATANHRVDAVAASAEDARLLAVPRSSPMLRVRREYFDRAGRPIELGDDRYLPGSVAFEVQTNER